MTRTSCSLSEDTIERLNKASQGTLRSRQYLATLCVKRMKKNFDKIRIVRKDTVSYNNAERCDHKLYFLWSESVHNYLQCIRFLEKISVSRLISEAIGRYLDRIVLLLLRKPCKVSLILDALQQVYRKRSFAYRNVAGFHQVFTGGPGRT